MSAILEVCHALNSMGTSDLGVYDFIRELAASALDSSAPKPAKTAVRLLLVLQGDADYSAGKLKGDEWTKERKTRIERWLREWKSIREKIAGLQASSGPFFVQVSPPEETGLPAGVTPKAIKDPILRKRYEEAIKRNFDNANAFREKDNLEEVEKLLAKRAKRYIVEAYCKPPFRTEEMDMLLEKYGIDQKTRVAMVEEMRRQIAERVKRDAAIAKAIAASKAPKPPEPFLPPPVGTAVDGKLLSTDPKLQVPITMTMKKPKVQDLLQPLAAKTGLQITVSSHIPKDRLAFWSVSYHNVPAWWIMNHLNQGVTDKGHWVKEENGYRLEGDLKPTLESLVRGPTEPPRGFPWLRYGLGLLGLAVVAAVIFWLDRRHKKPAAGA